MPDSPRLEDLKNEFAEIMDRMLDEATELNGGIEPEGEWWDHVRALAGRPTRFAPVFTDRLTRWLGSSMRGAFVGGAAALVLIAPLAFL